MKCESVQGLSEGSLGYRDGGTVPGTTGLSRRICGPRRLLVDVLSLEIHGRSAEDCPKLPAA